MTDKETKGLQNEGTMSHRKELNATTLSYVHIGSRSNFLT